MSERDVFLDRTMTDVLCERAKTTPSRVGYIFTNRNGDSIALNDETLFQKAMAVAQALSSYCARGDRAFLLFPPGPDYLSAFFGCLMAGVIAVPFYPPSRRRRKTAAAVLADCQPSVVLTTASQHAGVKRFLAQCDIPLPIWSGGPVDAEPHTFRSAHPDDVAFLQYTSGSTGTPKGVVIRHRDLMDNQAAIAETFGTKESDVCVSWLPLYHDMGLIGVTLHAMYKGFTSVLQSPVDFLRDPSSWLQAITQYKATICGAPNFAFGLCVDKCDPADFDLSSLRLVFNGSEPVQAETVRMFLEAFAPAGLAKDVMFPCYGMAEATLLISGGAYHGSVSVDANQLAQDRLEPMVGGLEVVPCGRPSQHIVVVDPETRRRNPDGQVGEIWYDGPGVAAGYWQKEALTRATFQGESPDFPDRTFLRTGDLGAKAPSGLVITGRLKDVIIIRGRNYYPQDIERIATQSDPLLKGQVAAAISLSAQGTESLGLLVECPRHLEQPPVDTLARNIRSNLAEQLDIHLQRMVLVPKGALPRTSSGKIQRAKCRQKLADDGFEILASVGHEVVNSDEEIVASAAPHDRLRAFVADLAGVATAAISMEQPLVQLGLDSFMAAELAGFLSEEYSCEVQPEHLLEGMSLQDLLQLVQSTGDRPSQSVLPDEGAAGELSFEQERLWLLDQLTPGHPGYHVPAVFRLMGPIDPDRLRDALYETAIDFDSLKTHFRKSGLRAERKVLSEPVIQWRTLNVTDRESIDSLIQADIQAPFDMQKQPPWRASLFQVGEQDAYLVLTFHHILIDLQSLAQVTQRLSEHYQGETDDRSSIDYGRFVAWQHANLDQAALAAPLAWWQENLRNLPAPIMLPTDKVRPQESARERIAYAFELNADLVHALRTWSAEHGYTIFATLMAGFTGMLHRYSGLTDLPIASPIGGRPLPVLRDAVGFFAYPLVLRHRVNPDQTLAALVSAVRDTLHHALAHAAAPPAQIMDKVRPPVSRAWHPLYQIMFSCYDREIAFQPEGIQSRHVMPNKGAGDLDLFMTLIRAADRFDGVLEYDPALFDVETISALVALFEDTLKQCLDDPGQSLRALTLPRTLASRVAKAQERLADEVESAPFRIAVTANFTAEPLEDGLYFWSQLRDQVAEVLTAPYDQVFPQLLDQNSELNQFQADAILILLRLEDWYDPEKPNHLDSALDDLAEICSTRSAHTPLWIGICPPSDQVTAKSPQIKNIQEARHTFINRVQGIPNVAVTDLEILADVYSVAQVHDPHTDREAHVPYTEEWFAAASAMAMRWIDYLQRPPFKVIALDCDQTLWGGVIGESKPSALVIDGAFHELQSFMATRKDLGFLLCLVSKNRVADVRAVFEQRQDFPLQWDDFAAVQINWDHKSENLQALAHALDLGMDSFVFVDDNPIEIAEVRANCRAVTPVALPEGSHDILPFLKRLWVFDKFDLSAEDARRTDMYRENRARQVAEREAPSMAAFLADLALQIEITDINDWQRAVQLNQRTNQFRTHPARMDMAQMQASQAQGSELKEIHVRDRFGDYGIVGQLIFSVAAETVDVDVLLLSCRALGRGVEYRMLNWLGEQAQSAGADWVCVRFETSERNLPAQRFLEGLDKATLVDGFYRVPVETALMARPDTTESQAVEVGKSGTHKVAKRVWNPPPLAFMTADAATLLSQIREATAERQAKTRSVDQAYAPPETELQQELADIFSELLGVSPVGIHDNFMARGGYSLQGVKLIHRIQERYGVEIPLATFFEGATVAILAETIEDLMLEQVDESEFEALMGELEGLSEEEIAAVLAEEDSA